MNTQPTSRRRHAARHRPSRRRTAVPALAAAALAALVVTAEADAQSALGDFRPWIPSVLGGVGTDPSDPGNFTILVDDDGDLTTPPVPYNLGAQAPDLAFATNYQLSPTRNSLYVLADDGSGVNPDRVWFADLDGAGGIDVVHGPFQLTGQFGNVRVAQGPFYYESVGGLRTAVLILENSAAGELFAQMFDLNTPGTQGRARVDLERGLGIGWFAPAGTHLVIKNGITDIDTQFVDYTLINACGTGGDFGVNSDIRVTGTLVPPDPVFSVTRVGGGTIDVIGQIPGDPNAIFSGTLPDCGGAVAPEFGACCIDLGNFNVICIDGRTLAECGAGVFTPNAACADVCVTPTIDVAGSAPGTVGAGDEIAYSFSVTNSTGSALQNVPVFAAAPEGTSIVSVTAGGTVVGSNVNWLLPGLAVGQSASFTMTVLAPCASGPVLLEGAAYGAQLGFSIFTGTDITTNVIGEPPVDLAVESVPAAMPPLRQGDAVVHTITMTNTGTSPAEGVAIDCFALGNGNALDQIIDDAGGTVVGDLCAPGSVSWTGTIPAGETRTLIFSTVVECVSQQFPGGPLGSLLNGGIDLFLRSAEPCSTLLDRADPVPIETVAPLTSSIDYAELAPNTLRFNPVDHPPFFTDAVIALGRLGEEAEVVLTVENTNGPDLDNATAVYALRDTFDPPADDPSNPFIGTPPAGVTFDAGSETVRFEGPLATGETVEIRLRLVMASPARPIDGLTLSAAAGCELPPGGTDRAAFIYAVPASPEVGHTYSVTGFDHYRHDDPTDDGVDAVMPDFYVELLAGIAAGQDRSLYVADVLFSYVINPDTLSFNVFEDAALPQDADPASGGALHTTEKSVWRYLPDGTRELVYDDQDSPLNIVRAVATTDGRIHVLTNNSATSETSVASIDPASGTLPLDEAALSGSLAAPTISYAFEPDFGPVLTRRWIGIADDGDDIHAVASTTWDGTPSSPGLFEIRSLIRIDPDSGEFEVVEPELAAYSGFDGPPIPAAADPVFRQQFVGGPVAVSRTEGPIFELGFGNSYAAYDAVNRIPLVYLLPAPKGRYQGIALIELDCGRADLNLDGVLDLLDAALFADLFQAQNPTVDFNTDGLFDLSDVTTFIDHFAAGCPG